jgi:ribosomal protein S18 acetylase RimI-like enzyme
MMIKFAEKKDKDIFIPIKKEFFGDYGIMNKSVDFILEEFKDYLQRGVVILAIENKKVIGYISGLIESNSYEKFGYIEEVFVKQKYRKKGISSQLKDKFLEFLKSKDVILCRIDVNPDNPAQETYKKWGFKIDKHRMSLNIS